MLEMYEVIPKVILLFGLFFIAWFDYQTELIDIRGLLVMAAVGALCLLLQGEILLLGQALLGMLIGGGILCFAWLSRESVGFGDGWLFVVTGIFLGFLQNFILLFGSVLLAGMFAIACLVLKKKGRDDRIALAPFVLTAYVVFVL